MRTNSQPQTVLIIDDTPDNLRFLSDLLTRAGYSVRKVISGELGLEAARLEPPDLILLDIKMPGMDGYQVCDQLKSSSQTRSIPVIFLSAMSEELDKVMAFEAGCVDYITKPFQVVEVLARIENHLQVSRLRQALEQQNRELQRTIAQRASVETALEQLNQGFEIQVQSRTADLRASLDQALRQAVLTPEALQVLQNALEKLMTAVEQLDALAEPHLASKLQTISSSSRSIQQVLTAIWPTDKLLHTAKLTQFCQRLIAQWPLPESPAYQLATVSWGKPAGLLQIEPERLKQALSQILANALHYSPEGGSVLCEITYQPAKVLIQMRDEGIGIPPAELDRIGEQFYRASNAKAFPGQGLGLFVAQQQLAGQGQLSVDSQLGEGTTVTLALPVQPAEL